MVLDVSHPLLANIYSAVVFNKTSQSIFLRLSKADILEDDLIVGYFQKWIEGSDLYVKLDEEEMFLADKIRNILENVILAQDFLKRNHLLHDDLKVENILEREDGEILLTDFDFTHKFKEFPHDYDFF